MYTDVQLGTEWDVLTAVQREFRSLFLKVNKLLRTSILQQYDVLADKSADFLNDYSVFWSDDF